MTIPIPNRRSIITDSVEGLEIVIPAKRYWSLIIFLGFWIVGWAFGENFAFDQLVASKSLGVEVVFIIVWLLAWTFGGGFAVLAWLWTMFGKEKITLRADALVIRQEILGFGPKSEYDITAVRSLRVIPSLSKPKGISDAMKALSLAAKAIAFDFGDKTIRFGDTLDEAEAIQIIKELTSRHNFPGAG